MDYYGRPFTNSSGKDTYSDVSSKRIPNGLPNLTALLSEWEVSADTVTVNNVGYAQLLEPDPERWYVQFTNTDSSSITIGFDPTWASTIGIIVPPFSTYKVKYKDTGPIIGWEWFVDTNGRPVTIVRVWASIRKGK